MNDSQQPNWAPFTTVMTIFAFKDRYFVQVAAVLCICILLARLFASLRKWPSAPGPKTAAYTNLWYLWKVSQGKFETWNIHQHKLLGKILRVAPGMYSISDPAAIQTIYGVLSPMPKSTWYEAFGDPRVPNHNLFSALDRTAHASMRRKVANMYSMTAISKYEPCVNNCTRLLLSQFDRLAESREKFDLQRWMQCYAFDVVGEITFGSRVGFLESGGQDIDSIMVGLEKGNSFSTLIGIQKLGAPFYFLRYGNPIRAMNDWVRRATSARADVSGNEKSYTDVEGLTDFYSKLQSAKEKDAEDYKRHKMDVILTTNIAAGSDTTSIALTATIFYLARSPSAYKRLRSEVLNAEQNLGAGDQLTFEHAQKLPYLQAVIKEALRLWPATGLPMWRAVQEPGATIAGTHFPPGAIVGMNSWVLHRDSRVFAPDPDTFRPERWLESDEEQIKSMERCYMPFGLGTRTCIGKNVSILEMSKVIPELVKRYNFQVLDDEMKYTNHWFVKPQNVSATIERA